MELLFRYLFFPWRDCWRFFDTFRVVLTILSRNWVRVVSNLACWTWFQFHLTFLSLKKKIINGTWTLTELASSELSHSNCLIRNRDHNGDHMIGFDATDSSAEATNYKLHSAGFSGSPASLRNDKGKPKILIGCQHPKRIPSPSPRDPLKNPSRKFQRSQIKSSQKMPQESVRILENP